MTNVFLGIIDEDINYLMSKIDFRYLEGKSILITGASGLLGSYFLATLRNLNLHGFGFKKITAVIHSAPGEALNAMKNDFLPMEVLVGDLTSNNFLNSLGDYDVIIHAASYGQPGKFMENQLKTIELNTTTTIALLRCLKKDGKFLFISSSEVYSGLESPPYSEGQIGSTNTMHPRACYIEGKRCGEAICNIHRAKGIDVKSARLALAYGPGTKPKDMRVLNVFIERALVLGKLSLQDMGTAKRTYCYVRDAIEMLWNILLFGTQPVYNVGGESKITIAELAGKIAKSLGVTIQFPENVESQLGAPDDVYLNLELVKSEFGLKDLVGIDAGLAQTIKWQKELYKIS